MAEYEFSKEELEEIVIIACLNNLQVLSKAASLPEDIFKDEYLRWVFIKIKKFYKKYRKLIKKNILMSELEDEIEDKKQPIYTQVVNELYNYEMDDLEDVEYSIEALKTLVNRRSILSAIDDIIAKLKADDIEGAIQIFHKPVSEILIDIAPYKSVSFDDDSWDKRSKRRLSRESIFQNKLKLNLWDDDNNFDKLAKNTLAKGRNSLWLAPPKGGKTTMAIHCAIESAKQGKNVLVIDRENGGDLIEDRIDASLLNIPIDEIETGEFLKNYSVQTISKKRKKCLSLNNKIRVIFLPNATIWDTYAILEQYKYDDGWIPEVIVDDYPAMMRGKTNNNKTQYIEDRYKEFDALIRGNEKLKQESYLGISFIHTISGADDEEYTPQDISWAKNVGQKVDGLNGLLRNRDERRENTARIQFLYGRHWGQAEGRQICVNFNGELCKISPMRREDFI